jgi:hypothetical protein
MFLQVAGMELASFGICLGQTIFDLAKSFHPKHFQLKGK